MLLLSYIYLVEVASAFRLCCSLAPRLGSGGGAQEKQSERQKATIIRFKFIFLEILLVPDALMYKKPLVPLSRERALPLNKINSRVMKIASAPRGRTLPAHYDNNASGEIWPACILDRKTILALHRAAGELQR
jgi:hypothetical protein